MFDGIVFSLQRSGGISVLFTELISRLPAKSYEFVGFQPTPPSAVARGSFRHEAPRLLERYRRARTPGHCTLFHSTYYRVPASRGPRVITTIYDYVYERYAPAHKRALHSFQKRKAIRNSDKLICISENTRRDLIEFEGPSVADRAVVVPLAASDDFHPVAGAQVHPQVVFVGSRATYKNFSGVVEALSSPKDLHLVIVGGGALSVAESSMLERLIPGRYRTTGYITGAELNAEYNRSLCLVYPSLYEGFGIPILEAMRAGCPVIAVNASSVPEVAGSAAILLERGHPDEIRAAVESLRSGSTRAGLVQSGNERARGFSWDSAYSKTIAVYNELTGGRFTT